MSCRCAWASTYDAVCRPRSNQMGPPPKSWTTLLTTTAGRRPRYPIRSGESKGKSWELPGKKRLERPTHSCESKGQTLAGAPIGDNQPTGRSQSKKGVVAMPATSQTARDRDAFGASRTTRLTRRWFLRAAAGVGVGLAASPALAAASGRHAAFIPAMIQRRRTVST